MSLKRMAFAVMMVGAVSMANAEICKETLGSITCAKGIVKSLIGNGMVAVNGTTFEGPTLINGMLIANDANFSSLKVNGHVSLMRCTVSSGMEIKGSLKASTAKFESSLDIYSSSTWFINSKITSNLHIHHIDNSQQEVYLDNNSEIGGDIVFDDGHGKVNVSVGSKIGGSVIGGEVVNK